MENEALQNTLTQLVDMTLSGQSNLTSFNPLVLNNVYAPLTLDWMTLTYMYKSHGVLQTAIDMPVLDSLRGGLNITSGEIKPDEIKDMQDLMEELDIMAKIGEAMTWARLFGGAALLVNTNQKPETPLRYEGITDIGFHVVNRWELGSAHKIGPSDLDQYLLAPWEKANAKGTEFYDFYGKKFHYSRVLTLSGKAAPHLVRQQLQGWGMSEVERMIADFNIFLKTRNVLYELLEEAKIDVFMIEGFKGSLLTQQGTANVMARFAKVNQLKNFNKALVMDKEDVYEQKQIAFAGLAEVMKENRIGIASALRMPMTKLFGISAAGFSSGEDDIENYNAMVESEVRQPMRRVIRQVLSLLQWYMFHDEFDMSFDYKPLRIMSSVEEEQVKTSKHNRYIGLFDRLLLTANEVGMVNEKEGLLPIETEMSRGVLDDHPMPETHVEGQDVKKGPDGLTEEKQGKEEKPTPKEEKAENSMVETLKNLFAKRLDPIVWRPEIRLEPRIDIVMPKVTSEKTTLLRNEQGQIIGSTKENVHEGDQ